MNTVLAEEGREKGNGKERWTGCWLPPLPARARWPPAGRQELGEQADADTGLRWLTGSYVWAFVSAPDTRQTRSVLIQLGTLVPCWP